MREEKSPLLLTPEEVNPLVLWAAPLGTAPPAFGEAASSEWRLCGRSERAGFALFYDTSEHRFADGWNTPTGLALTLRKVELEGINWLTGSGSLAEMRAFLMRLEYPENSRLDYYLPRNTVSVDTYSGLSPDSTLLATLNIFFVGDGASVIVTTAP